MLFEYSGTLKRGYIRNIDASDEPGDRDIHIASGGTLLCDRFQVDNLVLNEKSISANLKDGIHTRITFDLDEEDNSVYSFSHKSGLSSRYMYLKHLGSYGEIGVKYGTGIAYPRNLYVAPGAATICNELWVRNKISRETAVEKLQNMDTDTIIGPFYCDQSHIAWYWNYGPNIYKYEVPGYIVNFTGQHTA